MRGLMWLFRALSWPMARSFDRAASDPATSQLKLQKYIARQLAKTEYGRSLGVQGEGDFARVPVVDHDEIAPWIERQMQREGPILCADPVLLYEKTSGSSGPAKHIPYTAPLRRSFARMFGIWAHDLCARGPGFRTGKMYFSISPAFGGREETAQGVPVGLEDDAEYLTGWMGALARPFFVSPPGLAREQDPEVFKRRLCEGLLDEAGLEIVSVWNPSFLRVQLEYIAEHRASLAPRLTGDRMQALLRDPIDWPGVWPELKLISCWASANAARGAADLAARFPGVTLQGKGLLATEAPIAIPMTGAPAMVPLIDEVLIELLDDQGALRPLVDGAEGQTYEVVISQKGGLVRYRLGDRIRISGRYRNTPCIEFLGRASATSDLVGEKLHEAFVRDVVDTLGVDDAVFVSLVPVRDPADGYVLILDRAASPASSIERGLEEGLMTSYHYRNARMLGQLAPARVQVRADLEEALVAYHRRRGMKWGDMKSKLLVTTPADRELARAIG